MRPIKGIVTVRQPSGNFLRFQLYRCDSGEQHWVFCAAQIRGKDFGPSAISYAGPVCTCRGVS